MPGTQASTLVDQNENGKTIYNAVRMGLPLIAKSLTGLPKDQWVEVMGTEHTPGQLPPARTSLQDGLKLTIPAAAHAQTGPVRATWPSRLDHRYARSEGGPLSLSS